MNYYAALDANGVPTAFYNDDIYPLTHTGARNPAIPTTAIVISEQDWMECNHNPGQRQFVNGVITPYVAPAPTPKDTTTDDVNTERDRRIFGGIRFQGHLFQTSESKPDAITNILGATQVAFMAVVRGAQPGNYRWADPGNDFVFIAEDNSLVRMDAQTMVAFGNAVAAYKSKLTYTGRVIKNAILAGATVDIYQDATWHMAMYGDPLPPAP